ncbi:hypothetical protein [Acinetobacter sp. ABJ_C5_2]|uniref:DUF7716 domain-containing protein n=1 Tax=Acinetobacter sp. ABJ_C5_2 TaxID=3376992 RepID=UPI0037CB6EE9
MSTFKNKVYKIEDFINLVKEKKERLPNYDFDYCYAVYAKDDNVRLHDEVFIGNSVDFDENDNEVYPAFVITNGYHYFCSDQNIQDVVDLALRQDAAVSNEKLIDALNYYIDNDDFKDQ